MKNLEKIDKQIINDKRIDLIKSFDNLRIFREKMFKEALDYEDQIGYYLIYRKQHKILENKKFTMDDFVIDLENIRKDSENDQIFIESEEDFIMMRKESEDEDEFIMN